MNIKSNKGYVGIDVSVAVIILLIAIPAIMGFVFNANSSKHISELKTEAVNIAVNVMESAKGLGLTDVSVDGILQALSSTYGAEITLDLENDFATIKKQNATYKVTVTVTDYNTTNNSATEGVLKTVNTKVQFWAENQTQEVQLSTVLK